VLEKLNSYVRLQFLNPAFHFERTEYSIMKIHFGQLHTSNLANILLMYIANLHVAGSSQKPSSSVWMLLNLHSLRGHPKPAQSPHCEPHHGSKEMSDGKAVTANNSTQLKSL
jgi:hypothetical protein